MLGRNFQLQTEKSGVIFLNYSNGLFTFRETDADSDPIPVVGS